MIGAVLYVILLIIKAFMKIQDIDARPLHASAIFEHLRYWKIMCETYPVSQITSLVQSLPTMPPWLTLTCFAKWKVQLKDTFIYTYNFQACARQFQIY